MFTSIAPIARSAGRFALPVLRSGAIATAESIISSVAYAGVVVGTGLVGYGAVKSGRFIGHTTAKTYRRMVSRPSRIATIEKEIAAKAKPTFTSNDSDLYRQGQENLWRIMQHNLEIVR
jgi:hypothetical protein